MTKSLAFSPAISGKPVLLSVIPGKLAMLPAISDKSAFPRQFQASRLFPGNFRQQKTASSFRLFRPTAAMQFFFFNFSSVRILYPGQFHFRLSHSSQANHNLRLSHPGQSQFQALTSARRSTRPTVPSDHHYDKP